MSNSGEQAIADAVRCLRKKPGPVRVFDLLEEVAVRCRLLEVPCPSRPTIDRRLKRSAGVKVHRRGVAPPGNADPRISPGSFVVQRPLDVVHIDHTPMDIVVVDDLYRQPPGKPNLTLATDVATRCARGAATSLLEYVSKNRADIINYNRARRSGREHLHGLCRSVMNHVINRRMSKGQQMRWSMHGACLLQTR